MVAGLEVGHATAEENGAPAEKARPWPRLCLLMMRQLIAYCCLLTGFPILFFGFGAPSVPVISLANASA
jgi:hypothetical protein